MANKSFKVRTEIGVDKFVHVQLDSDIKMLELLSLDIDTTGFYKLHTSGYGCLAGRVLANDAVGIPNAHVSVFIPTENTIMDDEVLYSLYPYTDLYVKNENNTRYNLLPDEKVSDCHTVVGTFPSKRMVLDDDNYIEVFDSYYKFTTKTNTAGDYFIFGIPVGTHTIHTDIDLSDIGFLSQKPRDMVYKGYDINLFENPNKFKYSTNLDNLTQIISQNDSVEIYSFWGDDGNGGENVKISRNDVSVQYKFEPTCVFMGSIISDEKSQAISRKCIPTERMGRMADMVTGSGTIEMIRKTPDGNVEEFQIQGNHLIDGDGTWCYQIPMNLDYVKSDDRGNLVPTDDPTKGIPTRTSVRFRVSLGDYESDMEINHVVKVLVPNNPKSAYNDDGMTLKQDPIDYHFGSKTDDGSFKDLFWNNVYTVKSFIPRFQKGNSQNNKRFSGFKGVNDNSGKNHLPYNNIRVRLNFQFRLQCAMMKCLIWIMKIINKVFNIIVIRRKSKCVYIGDGICPEMEGWYFAPGCDSSGKPWKKAWKELKSDVIGDEKSIDAQNEDTDLVCLTNKIDYLLQCVEINLAMANNVINFDFYNDWVNGLIYVPRWSAKLRKKHTRHFLGIKLRTRKEKILACTDENFKTRRLTQQCALSFGYDGETGTYTKTKTSLGCKNNRKNKCHKKWGRKFKHIFGAEAYPLGGVIHKQETIGGEFAWYAKPCEWHKSYDNSYGNRYILYATDIVLLGSLNDFDDNGIPQAFKNLTPTTYSMPTNLASTNMDEDGYMYSHNGKGSICTRGRTTEPVEPITVQTFDNYFQWSKTKEYYEGVPDDVTEYAVTETSGVDWGYTGPNQGSPNGNRFYAPGGMFLGISCKNADVNIKSCVNLARACEIGSSPSSRNHITLRDGDNFDYVYTIPTGLISRDEIVSDDFRVMFATMNSNNLNVVTDPENGFKTYSFVSLKPTNFNGELKDLVIGNSDYSKFYNRGESVDDDETGRHNTQAVYRTLESTSVDYYMFRLGLTELPDRRELTKHYLIYDKTYDNVSIPMYENSFYFYFGLHDGSTALDKFFEKFYAPCNALSEDKMSFEIIGHDASYKNPNGGSIELNFTGIDSPYIITVVYNGAELNIDSIVGDGDSIKTYVDNGKVVYYTNRSNVVLTGLTTDVEGCVYSVFVSCDSGESFAKDIILRTIQPDSVRDIIIDRIEHEFYGKLDTIVIENKGTETHTVVVYYNDEKKTYTIPAGGSVSDDLKYKENTKAVVYLLEDGVEYFVEMITLHYNRGLDIVLYDDNTTVKDIAGDVKQVDLGDLYEETGNALHKWNLAKCIFYVDSVFDDNTTHSVEIGPVGGEPPYSYVLSGTPETVIYNGENTVLRFRNFTTSVTNSFAENEEDENDEYTLDMHDIMIPTKGVSARPNNTLFNGINISSEGEAVKSQYKYKCTDNRGDYIEADFHIYYAPFFFVTVFDVTNGKFKSCIVNGIPYNKIIGYSVNRETDDVDELLVEDLLVNSIPTINTGTYVESSPVKFHCTLFSGNTSFSSNTNDYSFSVIEGGPGKKNEDVTEYVRRRLTYKDVRFIDDDDKIFSLYDVHYYYVKKEGYDIDSFLTPDPGIYKKSSNYTSVINRNCSNLDHFYNEYIAKVDVEALIRNVGELKQDEDTLKDNDTTLEGNDSNLLGNDSSLLENDSSLLDNDESLKGAVENVDKNTQTVDENTRVVNSTNQTIADELGKLSEDLNNLTEESEFNISVSTGGLNDISDVAVDIDTELNDDLNGVETTEDLTGLSAKYKTVPIRDDILNILMYDITGKKYVPKKDDGYIMAVCDNWTRTGSKPTWANIWEFVTKHTDVMAVVKYYDVDTFREKLKEYLQVRIHKNFGKSDYDDGGTASLPEYEWPENMKKKA